MLFLFLELQFALPTGLLLLDALGVGLALPAGPVLQRDLLLLPIVGLELIRMDAQPFSLRNVVLDTPRLVVHLSTLSVEGSSADSNANRDVVVLDGQAASGAVRLLDVLAFQGFFFVGVSHVLNSEVAFAAVGPAVAPGKGSAVEVKLVVERQFFVLKDVAVGENADADFTMAGPLLGFAVRLARVVDEPGQVALEGRVDDPGAFGHHQVAAGRVFVLVHALNASMALGVEHLSNVLHHVFAGLDKLTGRQAPAFVLSLDGVQVGILLQLESPVAALDPARAGVEVALDLDAAINAPTAAVEGLEGVRLLIDFVSAFDAVANFLVVGIRGFSSF